MTPHPTPQARIDAILAAAVDTYSVPLDTLRSQDKHKNVAHCRQETMKALSLAGLNKSRIGRVLARDHSTVVQGCKRVDASPERRARAETLAAVARHLNLDYYLARLLVAPEHDRRAIGAYLHASVLGERRYWPCLCSWGLMLLARRPAYRASVDRALASCGMGQYGALIDLQARRLAS